MCQCISVALKVSPEKQEETKQTIPKEANVRFFRSFRCCCGCGCWMDGELYTKWHWRYISCRFSRFHLDFIEYDHAYHAAQSCISFVLSSRKNGSQVDGSCSMFVCILTSAFLKLLSSMHPTPKTHSTSLQNIRYDS